MAKRRGRIEHRLFLAIWDKVTLGGKEQTLRTFTVAVSEDEALEVMCDGYMGLVGCEGGPNTPRVLQEIPIHHRGEIVSAVRNQLLLGRKFIVPYDRMSPGVVVELVKRLMG